jgi:hypothetical protein
MAELDDKVTHPVMRRRWLSGHSSPEAAPCGERDVLEPAPPSSWSSRALAASVEGAKDGGALAFAELLTVGVVSVIAVELPMVGVCYHGSEVVRGALNAAIPLLVGAAASMGWTPNPELVMSMCERALRASVSGHIAPLVRRFQGPLMGAVEEAMRQESLAGRDGGR